MNNANLRALTGIRGIAALFVVMYHYTHPIPPVFFNNGYLAVDLFFILSGFIMTFVYGGKIEKGITVTDYSKFLYHRFARIYPLYLCILLFMISYMYFTGKNINEFHVSTNIILMQGLFGGSLVGASWSVSVEIVAYILFPAVCFLVMRYKTLSVPLFCICFLGLYYLPIANEFHGNGPLDIFYGFPSVFRGVLSFFMGVCIFIATNNSQFKIIKKKYVGDIVFILIVFTLYFKGFDLIYVLLCGVLISCLYHGSSVTQYALASRPMHFLGEISFSLYLIHLILNNLFKKEIYDFSMKISGDHVYSPVMIMLMMALFISTITFYTIEKPARNWLRNIEKKVF